MANSSAIDNALIAKLLADTGSGGLMTFMTDGVYWGEGPPGATRLVIVSLATPHDTRMFGGRAFEENTYMVKAVALSTSGGNVESAAARLDDLLEGGTLTIPGYHFVSMTRNEDFPRIRETERDEADKSILWQHRGIYVDVVAHT
jgi:hypothetical protein